MRSMTLRRGVLTDDKLFSKPCQLSDGVVVQSKANRIHLEAHCQPFVLF